MSPKPYRWAWCQSCMAWIGSQPPVLPNYWSNEKAAALHKSGIGHACRMMTLAEIIHEAGDEVRA